MIVENPKNVENAEIIVGIPSYNEADSIAYPTDVASRGLINYFPEKKSVIINVDNYSPDGTIDAFMKTPTKVPKIYISTPKGIKGKGNNLKNLFEAAVELQAKAVVVIDADLKSITPQWIQYLAEPIYAGFDFISPIYIRHKYDDSIANHIGYPLLRTLFGLRVRQPIGGDFGFSGRMARVFLSEKLWNDRVANYGIDIWMTIIAIARRFKVCQTYLGSTKSHRKKDPIKELGPMFKQVVMTIFDLMIEFEYLWKETSKSLPSSIFGFGLGDNENPPAINVNKDALYNSFLSGFDSYNNIWEKVICQPELIELNKVRELSKDKFYYHSDLWARTLFDFAISYRNNELPKEKIIEALIPFYHSRLLSFVNKTSHMKIKECEEYFESIMRVFESEKYYLIKRWDQDQIKLGHRLFKRKV
jgi:glycosyltransferase involved in cell wall biosynthesis